MFSAWYLAHQIRKNKHVTFESTMILAQLSISRGLILGSDTTTLPVKASFLKEFEKLV